MAVFAVKLLFNVGGHRNDSIEKLKAALEHSNVIVSLTYLRGLDVAELKEEDMPIL